MKPKIQHILDTLEDNSQLDTFFIPCNENPDNYEVIIKTNNDFYIWDEKHGLEKLIRKPIDVNNNLLLSE